MVSISNSEFLKLLFGTMRHYLLVPFAGFVKIRSGIFILFLIFNSYSIAYKNHVNLHQRTPENDHLLLMLFANEMVMNETTPVIQLTVATISVWAILHRRVWFCKQDVNFLLFFFLKKVALFNSTCTEKFEAKKDECCWLSLIQLMILRYLHVTTECNYQIQSHLR